MAYSDKVLDHYRHPRNVGSLDKGSSAVGTGLANYTMTVPTPGWAVGPSLRADGTAFHRITHDPWGGAIGGLWWTTGGSHIRYFWWCTQEFQRCGG